MKTPLASTTPHAVARGALAGLALASALGGLAPMSVAVAQPAAGSASPTVDPRGQTVATYAWPADETPEPKEEEWANATPLETVRPALPNRWWGGGAEIVCTQRVLREWVRVVCTPPHEGEQDVLVGVLWGMAGDLDDVTGQFEMAAELPRYAKPPESIVEDLSRKMGASATVTFPARPGRAMLLSLDEIGWDESYDGSNVFSRSGIILDVSWARGEKGPTILYR